MRLRARWLLAQRPPKFGAADRLQKVLTETDVGSVAGGTWVRTGQRTWRAGLSAAEHPWSARAKAAGGLVAWRAFRSSVDDRYLWVELIPLAASADAAEALDSVGGAQISNLRSRAVSATATRVSAPRVAGASDVRASENGIAMRRGHARGLVLSFAAGRDIVVMNASDLGDPGWNWEDLGALAAIQASRAQSDAFGSKPAHPWNT